MRKAWKADTEGRQKRYEMAPYFEVRPEEEEFLGYAIGVKVCPFAMVMVFLPVLFQPQGRKGTRCPFFVLPFFLHNK